MNQMLTPMIALVGLLAAVPAWADAPPRVLPAHDVAVSYDVSGPAIDAIPALSPPGASAGAGLSRLQLAWDAGRQALSVRQDGRVQRLIVDLPGHRATMLDDTMHVALFLPMKDTDVGAMTMRQARFSRRGTATVAGETCTNWAVTSEHGNGMICLTDDGVPLRGHGVVNGRQGDFTATSIDRGPARPGAFDVPAGYNRLELPRFGR